MQTIPRIILATTAVALLHSALASRSAKHAAARLVGETRRNAFYRPFYLAQSLLTFGGLLLYLKRLPNRVIWHGSTGTAWVFNSLRLAALGAMVSAVRQIGIERLTGWAGVQGWRHGQREIAPEPEAQGPALDRDQPVSGAFSFSRHPLNFLGLPLIWLTPRLTRNRFLFNLLATVYLVLGSWHEEHRLRLAYGTAYEGYRRQTRFVLGRRKAPSHLYAARNG